MITGESGRVPKDLVVEGSWPFSAQLQTGGSLQSRLCERAGLDASSLFADWDDGNSGEQARVVGHSENPFCVLLGLFLTYKSLGGARNEFGGYEIDPVISHVIFLVW